MEEISKEEGVLISDETLLALVETSGGDMRKAITSLQSCSRLKDPTDPITTLDVMEVTGVGHTASVAEWSTRRLPMSSGTILDPSKFFWSGFTSYVIRTVK